MERARQPVMLKVKIIETINQLKESESEARRTGNIEMASGICMSRVMLEEAYRDVHGTIPTTINEEFGA